MNSSFFIELPFGLFILPLLIVFRDQNIDLFVLIFTFSVTLNNIIQKSFPEEYAERKSEQESLTHLGVDIMPLFVMDVVLPCQKMSLNIFEPRYRLMVCVYN